MSAPRAPAFGLPAFAAARIFTTAIFMTYPACLAVLEDAWGMTSTQAGVVQGVFTGAFALSMLATSILSDRIGAVRIFNVATVASAITAAAFAAFARSYESALATVALVAIAQGAAYTPSMLIASANAGADRKATAMGWVLAGMSAGYVVSILVATAMLNWFDYRAAFAATAALTLPAIPLGLWATRHAVDAAKARAAAGPVPFAPAARRNARLLTLGYVGHAWELFGAWAWVPAFLMTASLASNATGSDGISYLEIGLWTALALHFSGFIACFTAGYAADRFGARAVLIAFAATGAVCSLGIGWLVDAGLVALFALAAVYGFATIGDSAVLSSAMTVTVPAAHLGKVLGVRSVLGIGVGALAPVGFGAALDIAPAATEWGFGFSLLGLGALVALACAWRLR